MIQAPFDCAANRLICLLLNSQSYWVQVAVLVLAALGKFTLWGAVLVDVGTALVVILYGMLLMRWRLQDTSAEQ